MPQAITYHDLTLEELSSHPVKLGFEFEFASRRSHRTVGSDLADVFGQSAIGVVEDCYNAHRHGNYAKWNITSDSSINPSRQAQYRVELVSPILTPESLQDSVSKVFGYLSDAEAETNASTGMHITVSHPNVTDEFEKFDPIKLGILLDDIGMVQKFRGNLESHYAISLLHQFAKAQRAGFNEKRIRGNDLLVPWSGDPELLFLLTTKEPRIRRTLVEIDKYRSINLCKTSNHCVEVRSPGGDYLSAGPIEAIETARKILSSLVYACDFSAGAEEYHTKFLSFFESRIKPRPRPRLVDSPASVSFRGLPGYPEYTVTVVFQRVSKRREIDGWALDHNRAVYVQEIRIHAPLPAVPVTGNGIFSPSRPAPDGCDLVVDFNAVCSASSLLEENYVDLARNNPGTTFVRPHNVSLSSGLVGSVQNIAAKEIVGNVKNMLASSAFANQLMSNISGIAASIPEDCLSRIQEWVSPSVFLPSLEMSFARVLSNLDSAIASAQQAESRSSQIVNTDQFSSKLTARLAALRSAASTNVFSNVAPSDVPTSVPSSIETTALWRRMRDSLSSNYFMQRLSAVVLGDSSPRPALVAGDYTRFSNVAVALSHIVSVATQNPRLLLDLASTMHHSTRVMRELDAVANSIPRFSNQALRDFDVEHRRAVLANAFRITVAAVRLQNIMTNADLGTSSIRSKLESWLTSIINRVATTMSIFDGISGQAALVHNPRRLAEAIHLVASEAHIADDSVVTALLSSHVADTILRPTHLGRVHAELNNISQVEEEDTMVTADADADAEAEAVDEAVC